MFKNPCIRLSRSLNSGARSLRAVSVNGWIDHEVMTAT
jgi:hypothetical protein